jgi:colanic acid/amylovoran biosynthesis glycosyltransferase
MTIFTRMQAIAIASVHQRQYSETFIHNHIEQLPYEVHYLYGGYLPKYHGDDVPFLPKYQYAFYPFIKNTLREKIAAHLKSYHVRAVLAEYGPVGLEMLPVCRAANIPLMVYFHGYDIYRADVLNQYLRGYQELFKEATYIFVVSKEMLMRLIELGAPSKKLVLNPCGANMSLFAYHDAGKNDPILFSAARFEETKNPMATIQAFSIVLKNVPAARLRMAGGGSLLSRCKKLVRQLNIEHAVTFTGILSPVEVSDEMSRARAFVQHSVTSRKGEKEGAPVAIMEAGASGLPVVSTRHAGIKDIVVEQETGFLIDEDDIEGMAYYMEELLTDPSKASAMGFAAHQRVRQHFSLEKNIRLICQCMEQVMV